MNAKKNVVAITLGLALTHLAFAQTNITAADQPADVVASNQAPGTVVATSNQFFEAVSNPPADVAMTNQSVIPPENTDATVTTVSSNVVTTVVSNEVTTTTATNESSATADTNAVVVPVATIPLIQFQDVPITTAIENLARQAGINYLLDPKINYGQPDEKGQIIPEPTLSIRWENVTAEQALLALLDNYDLQLTQDTRTKIGRITIKEPGALPPLITRVIQLKYASVSNMEQVVESAFADKTRSKVVPDNRTSQLVVVATDREQTAVDTLVDELDKPTKQVLVETRLIEVSSNPSTAKGIDWAGTLAAQNVGFGNNVLGGQSGQPYSQTLAQTPLLGVVGGTIVTNGILNTITYGANNTLGNPGLLADTAHGFNPTTAFLNADGVKAVISFLNQDSDAQVIATPRVVTLDNETAHIEVTRGVPIFNNTAGTQGSPGGSTVTYTNLGTILDVTPHISANDYISLDVAPEVSDVFDTITKTVAGQVSQADEYDSRRVTTQVLIPNSNTLVMGGFIKDNTKNVYTKVPFMGDVPILGYAFRHESKSLDKDNLLIFITPTIVRDTDFQPSTTQFLKSSPIGPAKPMDAQKAWNSAKPHDWSNPSDTDPYLKTIDQNSAE